MGSVSGKMSELNDLVKKERLQWSLDNSLKISEHYQSTYLPLLERFEIGSIARMMISERAIGPLSYKHYSITNGTWTIEFGGGEFTDNIVIVHSKPMPPHCFIEKEFTIASEHKVRMEQVVGAMGYSICLRNCEHVAYFIFSGTWVSYQMLPQNGFGEHFRNKMAGWSGEVLKLINQTPIELRTLRVPEPIFADHAGFINLLDAEKKELDATDRSAYNVVFIGPTGCGKSSMVNRLFNKTVAQTGSDARSVTRDISIYNGNGFIEKESRTINVIDTVGLCDSVMSPFEVEQLIINKLKAQEAEIDRFVIVVSGRIELPQAQSIRAIMTALHFTDHSSNFVFVYNKADLVEDSVTIQNNIAHMAQEFGTGSKQILKESQAINLNLSLGVPREVDRETSDRLLKPLIDAVFTVPPNPARVPVRAQTLRNSCFIL